MLKREVNNKLAPPSHPPGVLGDEETLVEDPRSRQTPSQQVEEKLVLLMKASPVLVSQVQHKRKSGPR